jgi:hypothetical protein
MEKMVFAVVLCQKRAVAYPVRIMISEGKVSISLVKSSEEALTWLPQGILSMPHLEILYRDPY